MLEITDKRTDVWSRNFLIWKINFGLWAVVNANTVEQRCCFSLLQGKSNDRLIILLLCWALQGNIHKGCPIITGHF